MHSYQAHQLLSLTLVTAVVSVGTVLAFLPHIRGPYIHLRLCVVTEMWLMISWVLLVHVPTYSMLQRSLQVCGSSWVHLDAPTCAHCPNWVSVPQYRHCSSTQTSGVSICSTFWYTGGARRNVRLPKAWLAKVSHWSIDACSASVEVFTSTRIGLRTVAFTIH